MTIDNSGIALINETHQNNIKNNGIQQQHNYINMNQTCQYGIQNKNNHRMDN